MTKTGKKAPALATIRAAILFLIVVIVGSGALAEQPRNCGYYTNTSGHQVPRPCGDWRNNPGSQPQGATALCRDGTYSYSEHPYSGGTCSHHGGVAKHLQ